MSRKRLEGPIDPELARDMHRKASTYTLLLHQLIAEHLNLNPTDHKVLDFMQSAGPEPPMTAGRLAEISGLSSGAITGVLDRLEKGRFIRRERDPKDRRSVIIRFLPDRLPDLESTFAPLGEASAELWAEYGPSEQALIYDYFQRTFELVDKEVARLKGAAPVAPLQAISDSDWVVPRGDATRGSLEFTNGASRLLLTSGSDAEFARASFDGEGPKLEHREETLRVRYPRALLALLKGKTKAKRGEIRLCPGVPWELQINGGLSELECAFRELRLEAFKVRGGAQRLSLTLGTPGVRVPIEVHGGVERLSVLRPVTAAVRLRVSGGATKVELDTLKLDAVGGELCWETPGLNEAQPFYDIQVLGGCSGLALAAN
ncbi:MAG: MarR family transcriptional regulator [Polyangiaceae bacterium]